MSEPVCTVNPDGSKEWRLNGLRHRAGGPAIEWMDGTKQWWVNGFLHRLDGPAIERSDGTKEFWVSGVYIPEEMFYSDEFQVRLVMEQ